VIEQVVEHHVFRHQNFRDFHGCDRFVFRPHPKITLAPPEHKPFLGFLLTRNQTTADGNLVYYLSGLAFEAGQTAKDTGPIFL
jgi:hypothetical protein